LIYSKGYGSATDVVKTLAEKRNDKNTSKEGLSFLFFFWNAFKMRRKHNTMLISFSFSNNNARQMPRKKEN
jgi:hypothetical protein